MDVAIVIAAILLIGGVAAWLATDEINEELEDDELFDDLPHAPDGGALNRDP